MSRGKPVKRNYGVQNLPRLIAAINSGRKIHLISDRHADHDAIVRYCQRPGWNNGINPDYYRHNQLIRDNQLNLVHDDDVVIDLGDVGRNEQAINRWCAGLPGEVFVLPGNHDSQETIRAMEDLGWLAIPPFELKLERTARLMFSHYPLLFLDQVAEFNAHGHCHNNPTNGLGEHHFNLSVEMIDYKVVSLDSILTQIYTMLDQKILASKNYNLQLTDNEKRLRHLIESNSFALTRNLVEG